MSSSVHGGPFGELALLELRKDKDKMKKTLYKFAADTLMLYRSIIETTYLFAALVDKNTQKYYDDIVTISTKKLIIDVKASDLNRAVRFYVEVLGLECRVQKDSWAAIQIGDAEIHLYLNSGVIGDVEFYVEDLDNEVKKLSEKGVKFFSGMNKPNALSVDESNITSFPWGRTAFFKDSEGNELALVKDAE